MLMSRVQNIEFHRSFKMIMILGIIESIIFFVLAVIHFNWMFGGTWGFEKSVPTTESGEKIMNPEKMDSGLVGVVLTLFAIFFLVKTDFIFIDLHPWIMNYTGWIISSIFILRAIGEFRHIGFFKKIKNTPFAKNDTKYYSPLCLLIGLLSLIITIKT